MTGWNAYLWRGKHNIREANEEMTTFDIIIIISAGVLALIATIYLHDKKIVEDEMGNLHLVKSP